MAEPKYDVYSTLGAQIKEWLRNPNGPCPVAPCTEVVNNEQYRLISDASYFQKDRADLYIGPPNCRGGEVDGQWQVAPFGDGPYSNVWTHFDRYAQLFCMRLEDSPREIDEDGSWVPYYAIGKVDPVEHLWHAEERAAQIAALHRQHGTPLPEAWRMADSWLGVIGKGIVALEYVKRNYDEPPMSEVTNGIYSKLFPDDDLKAVFINDVRNADTRTFISQQLFSLENGHTWPPRHVSEVSRWAFDAGTEEYQGLLGTRLGTVVGYWMLGRYPRGTCSIPRIHIALSGPDEESAKTIDMCFEVAPTKPPHRLPEPAENPVVAAQNPARAAEVKPLLKPADEPAFLPSASPFGERLSVTTDADWEPLDTEMIMHVRRIGQEESRKRRAEEMENEEEEEEEPGKPEEEHGKPHGKRRSPE